MKVRKLAVSLLLFCLMSLSALAQTIIKVEAAPVTLYVHDGIYFQVPAHTVSLAWTASTDAAANPTLAYKAYRVQLATPTSTCDASKLVSVGTSATVNFTDTVVSVGQTYCYAVTATLNGGESPFSNLSQATIPIAAPTGATAKGN